MHTLPFWKQVRIITALVEGVPVRSTARMYGHHHRTVFRLMVLVGEACAVLLDQLICAIHAKTIEADEIWSFVERKQARVGPAEDDSECGDQWLWLAIDAQTKLILSYRVAKRTNAAAIEFMGDLSSRVIGRPQISTDGFPGYAQAVRLAFGDGADYAIITKEGAYKTACSVNHGSGRLLARGDAKRKLGRLQEEIDNDMRSTSRSFGCTKIEGIVTNTKHTPLDESGRAYKDLDAVLAVLVEEGVATISRRLYPVANVKGTD